MIYATGNDISFFEALEKAERIPGIGKAAIKIEKFVQLIQTYRSKLEYKVSISELIRDILETSGYEDELEKDTETEAQARRENLEELVNKAADYENTAEEPSLNGFLEEVALVADVDQMDGTEDRVTLMTLHGAKGLEFTKVYLTGLEDGLFPGSMAVNSEDPQDLEEERRLFYVGVTRAKKELTLTCARMRMVNGENRFSRRSRFLDEIPAHMLMDEKEAYRSTNTVSRTDRSSSFDVRKNRMETDSSTEKKVYDGSRRVSPSYQMPAYGGFGKLDESHIKLGKQFTVTKAESLEYGVGDRVHHTKFGDGTVKEITEQKRDYEVSVDFDQFGVKKMYASFAKLKKC
jgi:DNA helicase-2/ATP-dependent DNA helicase PcrA